MFIENIQNPTLEFIVPYEVVKMKKEKTIKKKNKIYTKIDWSYIQGINKCDTIIEVEI